MSLSPQPWTTKKAAVPTDGAFDIAIVDAAGEIIAECFGRTSETNRPDARANADLMAQAPQLRDLLRALIGAIDRCDREMTAIEALAGNHGFPSHETFAPELAAARAAISVTAPTEVP